ncbi:MAG: 16S rRNA (cytidine(1402)-2'-O)-methyltransferase, partial [Myxococcota bacterium]|nr:16S rRNA (cytidine(1402)-2'-O)-methyltransferase [Myxococcota bacterium]
MSGTLYVVATPIGNLEDITLRALRVLGSVPILAAEDTRAARRLLSRHGLWPRPGLQLWSYFEGNEAARGGQLLEAMTQGHDVALISEAGMPGVSDPGMRLVRAAAEAGLRVEVLPGASAALCALVGSGLPTGRFLFLGFPPRPQGQRQALFSSLRSEPGTLILLEAPERTVRTLAELA